MCKDTHIIASCALLLAVSLPFKGLLIPKWIPSEYHHFDLIVSMLACIFGAAAPDIDTARLRGKHNLAAKLFKVHRGITHSLLLPVIIFVLASYTKNLILASALIGFAFGWTAHVIEDCFNAKGCPLFMPFTKKHFHIAKFMSNSFLSKKNRLDKNRSTEKKSAFYRTEGAFLCIWFLLCVGCYKVLS